MHLRAAIYLQSKLIPPNHYLSKYYPKLMLQLHLPEPINKTSLLNMEHLLSDNTHHKWLHISTTSSITHLTTLNKLMLWCLHHPSNHLLNNNKYLPLIKKWLRLNQVPQMVKKKMSWHNPLWSNSNKHINNSSRHRLAHKVHSNLILHLQCQ